MGKSTETTTSPGVLLCELHAEGRPAPTVRRAHGAKFGDVLPEISDIMAKN